MRTNLDHPAIYLADVPVDERLLYFLIDEPQILFGNKKLFPNVGSIARKILHNEGVTYDTLGPVRYRKRSLGKQKILYNQLGYAPAKTHEYIQLLFKDLLRAVLSKAKDICTKQNTSCEHCPYKQMFIETFERRFKSVYGFVPDVK